MGYLNNYCLLGHQLGNMCFSNQLFNIVSNTYLMQ